MPRVNMSVNVSTSSTVPSSCLGSTNRMSRQMLSAVPGSLSRRYCLALSMAPAMPACVRGLSWKLSMGETNAQASSGLAEQSAPEHLQRVVEAVDDALLQRNDRVVGDRDVLGAHDGAALRDVAVPDAVGLFQFRQPIL